MSAAHLHPFSDPVEIVATPPRQMVSGDGPYVTDADGNTFFDAVSGLWCASLGFNPPRLRAAATKQMGELAYYHSFMGRTCEITTELADRLVEKLPGHLAHVFFGTSGSEAVETSIKFARYYQIARGKPEKRRVIARDGGYHGSLHMSAALTSMAYCHDGFDLPLESVIRIRRPHFFGDGTPGETEPEFGARLVRELEELIDREDPDTIAAFIAEPAVGSGGVCFPPHGYWQGVQRVLAERDILLIADEIITGFGRTGQWFGCETWDITPDLMTMAKQLTAAVFPLSAVAISTAVHDVISAQAHTFGTFGHGVTYGGHPVGAAVALETLAIYEELDLPTHVGKLGERLASVIEPIAEMPSVGDVRSVGLLAAVEFNSSNPGEANAVAAEAERRGVLFRVIDNTIAISPPYISAPEQLDHMASILQQSISDR